MTQKTKPLLLIKIKYWDENSIDTVLSMPVGRDEFNSQNICLRKNAKEETKKDTNV